MGGSASHIHLRFATISMIVVFVIGALIALAAIHLTRRSEESSAARTAERVVAAPVISLIGNDVANGSLLSDEKRTALEAFAAPLLNGSVAAIRIWSPTGVRIYSSGVAASDSESLASTATARRTAADGTPLFATYVHGNGYVVEVATGARDLDQRIATNTRNALLIDVGAMALLLVVLQIAFWGSTHGIASDHRRLARLYVTGEDLRASLDVHDVMTRVVREATARAAGTFGLIALYEHETGDIVLRATHEYATGDITHHQRSVEEWFLRRAVATNTTIVSSQSASAYEPFFGADLLEDQINVMCAPMRIRGRVIGVIAVVKPPVARGAAFTPEAIREVDDIAIQGAVAVEQALLFAKVRAYADEVELSYDATLKALMAALDAKDDVTEGHCERVAKLTVHLAKQLGVPDSSLVDIERGAMLHDVGKIGVPDAVLKKPAALDDMEWEAIRKHPLLAGMMISKIGFLEGATPILLYHHERFDGGGYPFGLTSARIPLEARLFSVVDAYDAMTSNRPYRDAMTHAAAMDEIHAGSGTQFDPAIVDVFARMMTAHPELRSRLPQPRETMHTDLAADPHAA